jgi:hypothetical protein
MLRTLCLRSAAAEKPTGLLIHPLTQAGEASAISPCYSFKNGAFTFFFLYKYLLNQQFA